MTECTLSLKGTKAPVFLAINLFICIIEDDYRKLLRVMKENPLVGEMLRGFYPSSFIFPSRSDQKCKFSAVTKMSHESLICISYGKKAILLICIINFIYPFTSLARMGSDLQTDSINCEEQKLSSGGTSIKPGDTIL